MPETAKQRLVLCSVLALVAGACVRLAGLDTPAFAAMQAPQQSPGSDIEKLVKPVAVFGEDDRRSVPPTHQSLARKIGRLTDLKSRAQCTAFCLGEDVIATAAHCLYRTRDETAPDLNAFRFSLDGKPVDEGTAIAGVQSLSGVAEIVSGSMSVAVRPPIEATNDWALVRLETPACVNGRLRLSTKTAAELLSGKDAVYQVAYHRDFHPSGTAEKLAYGRPCRVSRTYSNASEAAIGKDFDHPDNLILHTCDTGGASSGSPLLIDGLLGPEVVGINVGTYVLSRVLMIDGKVAHRYQSDNVANTGVSSDAFRTALDAFTHTPWISARTDMRDVQTLLRGQGYLTSDPTGRFNIETRKAIEAFEQAQGLRVTGLPTASLLDKLRASTIAKNEKAKPTDPSSIETGTVQGLGLTSSAKAQ